MQQREERVAEQLRIISREITQAVKNKQKYVCKKHLMEAYSVVYDNCTAKPAKCEQMLSWFKDLLLNHLM